MRKNLYIRKKEERSSAIPTPNSLKVYNFHSTTTVMEKIFIKTYGCSFNQFDSEIIASNLKKNGFEIVKNDFEADLIIINSCSVKNGSEAKCFNDISKYKRTNQKIIVSGCVPQAEKSYLKTKLKDISTIGTNDLNKIVEVVKTTLNGNVKQIVSDLKPRKNEYERLKAEKIRLQKDRIRNNKFLEIIPINEGCLNNCSYCKTKQARGNLFSYSIKNIKEVMEKAVKDGAKEIYLTSQDTACYGFDIGTNLVELLRELIKIDGDYKIRIGMGNPNHFKKIIKEVLEVMKNSDKIYKFLHIPLQSASNRILKEMNRKYTYEEYMKIIITAKLLIPNITIANDIIVAYPTETEEDFKETINSLKGTNVLNYSRFWLRPNTPAEKIYEKKDFISGEISKKRAKILRKKFEEISKKMNEKWIGWKGFARITENGKKGTNTFILRNDYYKPIIVKKKKKNKNW